MKRENIPFKRVFLIGVDGAGAFFKDTETPSIDRIVKNGAVTREAITAVPSISAQCWGSMLIGVNPDVHCLTNGYVEANPYPTDSPFPTVFRRIRSVYPDAALASFCNWNPINHGIVEHDLGVTFGSADDGSLTDMIVEYLEKNDPTFLFVQFDSVDGAGHDNGYGAPGHLSQITTVDSYIGKIYDTIVSRGMLEDSLFLVTADHGGTPDGSHGGTTDAELKIFFGAAGVGVRENGTIGEMNVRDITAVVLYALGIDVPEFESEGFSAQIPAGLFNGYSPTDRQSIKLTRFPHEPKPTPADTLGKYVDVSKIEAALFFDGDASDASGKCEPTVNGMLKFYDTGFFGKCAELGMRGSVVLPHIKLGKSSFTVSVWIYKDGSVPSGRQPALYCTKDRKDDNSEGIIFAYDNTGFEFKIIGNDGLYISAFMIPYSLDKGWMNSTLVVDREMNTVTHYINFGNPKTQKLDEAVKDISFDARPFTVGNDSSGRENDYVNIFTDDFILFSSALNGNEIEKLADYYKQ